MSRTNSAVVCALLVLGACDAPLENPPEASFRSECVPGGGAGLVGLDSVTVSGTPSISGAYPSVFSNELVSLAGSYDIDGDAISGGVVTISGSNQPDGEVIENAGQVTVPDPTSWVTAAKASNDNAKIPCIKSGKKCTSPVTGYALSLNAQQAITLPSGSYYFESISINGQAKLNVNGSVIIYLNGNATFNGGAATNPSNDSLTVISASSSEIKLNGGGSSKMHVYAPFATVRFSGTQGFQGSALAKDLVVSGTADINATDDLATALGLDCDYEEPPTAEDGGSTSGAEDGGESGGAGESDGGGEAGDESSDPPDLPGLPD